MTLQYHYPTTTDTHTEEKRLFYTLVYLILLQYSSCGSSCPSTFYTTPSTLAKLCFYLKTLLWERAIRCFIVVCTVIRWYILGEKKECSSWLALSKGRDFVFLVLKQRRWGFKSHWRLWLDERVDYISLLFIFRSSSCIWWINVSVSCSLT